MKTFIIKSVVHDMPVGFIVTSQNKEATLFKAELSTESSDPMVISRNAGWKLEKDGALKLNEHDFNLLCLEIEKAL
jgi:hypothetical protein